LFLISQQLPDGWCVTFSALANANKFFPWCNKYLCYGWMKMKWAHVLMSFFCFKLLIANPMGYEESKKHLLSLSYPELQCLCKRYNLPAKKTHSQLASSLASLLEVSIYVMFGL
jgi:hypothetical protein